MDQEPHRGRGLAVLLAAAAVTAAVLGAHASLLSSDSSGDWQQAVRQEVKAAAAAVEDIRFVYGDEAPQTYRVVEATIRAQEYRAAAQEHTGLARSVLLAEAAAQDQLRQVLASAAAITQDQRYAREDGGYDLGLRLANQRNRSPDFVAIRPDDPQAAGDRLARKATLETAATIPIALTFLFGSLAQAFGRRRRVFLALGSAALVAGLIAAVAIELTA